jgi:hypothetical protein
MEKHRARPGFAVAETDDVDALRARIRELESELRTRPAVDAEAGGGDAMKVVAAGLGVTTVLLAPPAFLTFRRWVRWWMS